MNSIDIKHHIIKYWKYIALVIIIAVGTYCTMLTGIDGFFEKPNFVQSLYHTILLFVLSPYGFPMDSDSFAYYILVSLYFIAPLFLLQTLYNYIQTIIYNPDREISKMRDHVVLAGLGKLGSTIFDFLREEKIKVVPVEIDEKNLALSRIKNACLPFIVGDFTKDFNLKKSNIRKAKAYFALSGNDVANVDSALLVKKMNPNCRCLIQISDPFFLENINSVLREKGIEFFNSYEIVARKTLSDIKSNAKLNSSRETIIIAGFGRFGKILVKEIYEDRTASDNNYDIVVIDKNLKIEQSWSNFCNVNGIDTNFVSIYQEDVLNSFTWTKILDEHKNIINIIVATDNDSVNLSTSFFIKEKLHYNVTIITRLFNNLASLEAGITDIKGVVFSDETLLKVEDKIIRILKRNK